MVALRQQSGILSVVAVDDECIALNGLLSQLSRLEKVGCVEGFVDPREALTYIDTHIVDVAFIDVDMGDMDGLTLAAHIKKSSPDCAIIFLTGHADFAVDAFKLKAHGYLLKPASLVDIKYELDALSGDAALLPFQSAEALAHIQTFGDFEVFVQGVPLHFPRRRCKEALAYLVDRRGSGITTARLAAVLWENREYDRSIQRQVQTILSDLMKVLNDAQAGEIVTRFRNHVAIDPSRVECDYYRFLAGDKTAMRQYTGEYMLDYSWAEQTAGELQRACQLR